MRDVLERARDALEPAHIPACALGPLHTAPTLREYWRVTRRFKLR